MELIIPASDASKFGVLLDTNEYKREERDYKVAVQLVMSALLSPRNLESEKFAELIADVFNISGGKLPDLDALGIASAEQAVIRAAAANQPGGAFRHAIANLAGGRWGIAQFIWIPRAVEHGLGDQVAEAFRTLVAPAQPLARRVDVFRDQLYATAQTLQNLGGFQPNWRLFTVSLSFAATVLGAYDASKYTFYSNNALRHGYARYAPGEQWPKGTAGERYVAICGFVQAIADELRKQRVPVRDLIDAQSFIWISYGESTKADTPPPDPPGEPKQPPAKPAIDLSAVAQDLAAAVYWPLERASRLVALTQRAGQLLFQGPPGTGKTFVAETLARLLAGDEEGRVELVQFHPSYAYEDFIEGIRPVVTQGSDLAYEIRKGVFSELAELAQQYNDDSFFLVIDELNRANLPRVFGELLYALEYRGSSHPFRLPYSGIETYIPSNITIIGTMNTADRSIALVDAAVRRRFRHWDFAPDVDVLKGWLSAHKLGSVAEHAAARLTALNIHLRELLDPDRLIGHTYLMREDLTDAGGFNTVWEEDIEPVLREHLFNQPDEIAKLREVFLAAP